MANRGRGNSTRGRSRGRPYTKGPLRAGSNSHQTSLPDLELQTHSREPPLPVRNNNKLLQHTDRSPLDRTSTSGPPNSLKETPGAGSSSPSEVQVSGNIIPPKEISSSGSGEGDNGVPLGGGRDDSLTAPSIALVLSELREIKEQVAEIKDIKQQISKLDDTIESTTGALSEKLTGVMNRTSELETEVRANSARLREYDDNLSTINTAVGKHEKAFSNIKAMKDDFLKIKDKAVVDMNSLVSIQKEQVDSFNSNSKSLAKNIMDKVDQKLAEAKRQADYQGLRDQAFSTRHNLVLVGLTEAPEEDTSKVVSEFFSKSLGLKNIKIGVAYRMGNAAADSSDAYSRPILVSFPILPQRNRVWKKRSVSQNEGDNPKVRIHADLPKKLRDGVQSLYMVAKAASSSGKYHSAKVRNYALELDGQVYLPSELEMLPPEIRPSSLAAPRSESALVFFSRHAILSNHHPSIFTIGDQQFHSMEQFLALRRAQLSGDASFIQRASEAVDPVQAKYILSALRQVNTQQWDDQLENTVMEGLEAKFRQNPSMKDYLCSTGDLVIGEASTNARWGVGMDLEDKDVLDVSKWKESGNLLGRSLMNLRSIFCNEAKNIPA